LTVEFRQQHFLLGIVLSDLAVNLEIQWVIINNKKFTNVDLMERYILNLKNTFVLHEYDEEM
jgi:hypothetical protein